MADRKAELERKKAKLESIRKERQRKEEEKRQREIAEAKKQTDQAAATKPLEQRLTEADQLLKDLGIEGKKKSAGDVPSPSHQADAPEQSVPLAASSITTKRKEIALTTNHIVTQTDIPPKELVTYDKDTQTTEILDKTAINHALMGIDEDSESLEVIIDSTLSQRLPQVEPEKPNEEESAPTLAIPKALSEEEKQQIEMTDEFKRFLDRTSRVMERALTENAIDIFIDYTGEVNAEGSGDRAGEKIKLNRIFYDEHNSKHRLVTSLDWSKQYQELMLASYNTNTESALEPDGICLVWNSMFRKDTPEYVFHCQSAVTSCSFAAFHPSLYIGATYSGQVVLWDSRNNKRMPVQRTPLSSDAHTHPIFCTTVVGTENAHNLISVSTDGKLCSWSLDMLSQPQDSINLQPSNKNKYSVAPLCISFMSEDVNNFVLGLEDGSVGGACRHGRQAGIVSSLEGHQGPVTGIDTHKVAGSEDFSHLYISSSFDWTVKLWSTRDGGALYTFKDGTEYVTDTAWSPTHPALFSSVDGEGKLNLWNLNSDTEVPSATARPEFNVALNKCRWNSCGTQLAAGGSNGKIFVYDISERVSAPRADEWTRFARNLSEMQAESADLELNIASPMR